MDEAPCRRCQNEIEREEEATGEWSGIEPMPAVKEMHGEEGRIALCEECAYQYELEKEGKLARLAPKRRDVLMSRWEEMERQYLEDMQRLDDALIDAARAAREMYEKEGLDEYAGTENGNHINRHIVVGKGAKVASACLDIEDDAETAARLCVSESRTMYIDDVVAALEGLPRYLEEWARAKRAESTAVSLGDVLRYRRAGARFQGIADEIKASRKELEI